MKKDFSSQAEEKLINICKSVEPHGVFETIGDWFEDRFSDIASLVSNDMSDIDRYHKKTFDRKNTRVKYVRKIFKTVRNHDKAFANNLRVRVHTYRCINLNKLLIQLGLIVNPKNGLFRPDIMDKRLSDLERLLRNDTVEVSPSYKKGHYGGNQSSSYERWTDGDADDIKRIVRKYYPGMSNKEIGQLLDEMQNEGCRYMAYVNTLFGQYVGREAEFEKTFGFPMYDANGNPNFDLLMVDFYCSNGRYDYKQNGLNYSTGAKAWKKYLNSKGISVDCVSVKISESNYYNYSHKGEIILRVSHPMILRNADGSIYWRSDEDCGHAMVIIGVTTINGKRMYKVATWGKILYFDEDEHKSKKCNVSYQQIRY